MGKWEWYLFFKKTFVFQRVHHLAVRGGHVHRALHLPGGIQPQNIPAGNLKIEFPNKLFLTLNILIFLQIRKANAERAQVWIFLLRFLTIPTYGVNLESQRRVCRKSKSFKLISISNLIFCYYFLIETDVLRFIYSCPACNKGRYALRPCSWSSSSSSSPATCSHSS